MNAISFAVYLTSHALLAASLGILATKLRFSAIPKAALFFAGVAVTPFAYSLITLLLLCIPFQLPSLLYTIFPVILAGTVLVCSHKKLRSIPGLIRSIPNHQKMISLISAILFPLLSVSPGIAAVIRYKLSSFMIALISLACGLLVSLICALLYKQIWALLKRFKRAALFSATSVLIALSILFAFLVDYRISRRINFIFVLLAVAAFALLAVCSAKLLHHSFGFSSFHSKKAALYYFTLSSALVFLRFGARQITYIFCGATQVIVGTTIFFALLVFSISLILFFSERILRKIIENKEVFSEPPVTFPTILKSTVCNAILTFSIAALLTAVSTIVITIPAPILGADATEYMTSASEIANTRTFASVNFYNGSENGSQIGVVHHPAWIAYLAQALMHGTTQPFGYPNDIAARTAFPMTYVYLLIAVYALARAFLPRRYSLLAAALAACTPQLGYLIALNSREGFRIIPILLLILVLYGYTQAVSKERRILWPELLVVFFTASFVMMGHVINAIPAAAIGLAAILFLILSKNLNIRTILMGAFAALGGVFGSIQIPLGYLEHGKLLSDIISLDTMLAGTVYLKNFEAYQLSRLGDTRTYLDRLNVLIRYDHGVLTAVGVAVGILFVILLIRAVRKRKPTSISGMIGLTGIFFALLFTDLFSWSGYTLSQWSIMNIRYLSHLYPLYAVLVAGGLYLLENLRVKRALLSLGISAALCCYAVYPSAQVGCTYPFENQVELYQPAAEAYTAAYREHQQYGGRILIDNYYCNYYFNCEAMTIFSDAANEIRRAQTLDELTAALKKEKIDAIMITYDFYSIYWEDTILLQLVNSSDYQETSYDFFSIYQKVS